MEPAIFFLIRQIGSFIIALAFCIVIFANMDITPFDSIWSFIVSIVVFIILKSVAEFVMDIIFFKISKP